LSETIDTLVADGAYYRADTVLKAQEKQLDFCVSAMTGEAFLKKESKSVNSTSMFCG